MALASILLILLSFASLSLSNVEKTIFLAPESLSVPNDASIDNLYLIPLSPAFPTARTRLNATFPADSNPRGSETWMLLQSLKPGTRYEVRICWLATQPTAFSLYTHTLPTTFETPELVSSLTTFAYARQAAVSELEIEQLSARRVKPDPENAAFESSLLFLQIFAAADYFSLDTSLMETVPPVLVDVILDPFLFNVFPKSLVPTAVYIVILAIVAWFLSGFIWKGIVQIARSDNTARDKKTS